MTRVTVYFRSRCGAFPLTTPLVARKVAAPGNGYKWAIMARRGIVSALVFERACSHNFKTKRAAESAIREILESPEGARYFPQEESANV